MKPTRQQCELLRTLSDQEWAEVRRDTEARCDDVFDQAVKACQDARDAMPRCNPTPNIRYR